MGERKFEVVLNRCTDATHENDITCDHCHELGSCAIIFGRRICSPCLDVAQRAIAGEIYNRIKERNKNVPS